MTKQEAKGWLGQVGARVLHDKEKEGSERAWATVIATPANNFRPGKIIITFGGSLEEAAGEAKKRWDALWENLSSIH